MPDTRDPAIRVTAMPADTNYTGPCRSGWVDSAYLEMQAE